MKDEPERDTTLRMNYYYRRPVGPRELLPAIGIAVGVGAAAFYFALLFTRRTPLLPKGESRSPGAETSRER